jgi:molybdate transport system substrate-binding protein
MKKLLILPILLSLFAEAGTLRVALAANVSYAMPELIQAFRAHHPNTQIQTTVSGSGKLTTQIRSGAPYDLFLSANMAYPQALFKAGATTAAPVVYAQGALAYLSEKARDFSRGIALLSDPAIARIAVANPRTAPYGKATFEALTSAKLLSTLRPKFIYGESIAQTVTYTTHGADIGIIAKSALYAPQMRHYKAGVNWADVDASLYRPIDQGMVVLKASKNMAEVKALYDFLLSDEARAIFTQYGYRLP